LPIAPTINPASTYSSAGGGACCPCCAALPCDEIDPRSSRSGADHVFRKNGAPCAQHAPMNAALSEMPARARSATADAGGWYGSCVMLFSRSGSDWRLPDLDGTQGGGASEWPGSRDHGRSMSGLALSQQARTGRQPEVAKWFTALSLRAGGPAAHGYCPETRTTASSHLRA